MADYVKKRTHIINHPRFLEAGAIARDLYDWGMLWSGQLETDGDIPMAALLASPWGAGQKKNVAIADKLVSVGLWEKTATGYRICKWSEQGNVTKADLEAQRAAARERMRSRRSANTNNSESAPVRANIARTSPEVPTSHSPCTSGSGSSGGAGGPPPDWFVAAVGTAAMAGAPVPDADIPARWLQFLGSMERRKTAPTQVLANSWLVSTIRSEREKAANERERRGPKSGAEVTKQPYDENAPWMKAGDTGS